MNKKIVAVIMGSDSDLSTMKAAVDVLKKFGIGYDIKILSAHRTPKDLDLYINKVTAKGLKIIIAGAGGAAHLAGVIASKTTLPVIGVPIETKSLKGLDSLLSTVQMPSGVPVATMAIGSTGAKNAALFAVEILALNNEALKKKMRHYRDSETKRVILKNLKISSF